MSPKGIPTADYGCIVISTVGFGPFVFEKVQGIVDTLERLFSAILKSNIYRGVPKDIRRWHFFLLNLPTAI